jgi:hypothetical protein
LIVFILNFSLFQLLKVAYRDDANERGLRASAFEAITSIVQNGAQDSHPLAFQTVPHFLEKLTEVFLYDFCFSIFVFVFLYVCVCIFVSV